MVVPTIEVVDMKKGGADMDKGVEVDLDKGVEQPIDKINISAFVSDFNSDEPNSSSEVLKMWKKFLNWEILYFLFVINRHSLFGSI